MKKFITILAAAVGMIVCVASCQTKIVAAQYKFDADEIGQIQIAPGHEADGQAFLNDLGNVLNSYSGTTFTDDEICGDITAVVNRYNNKYLDGTFSLYKANGESQNWFKLKTWTLTFGPK